MPSSTGRKVLIFSSVSTISMTNGKSSDSRRIFVVCNPARVAKAHGAPQYRRAGQMRFPRLQHNSLIERPALALVVFADENAKQNSVTGKGHRSYFPG